MPTRTQPGPAPLLVALVLVAASARPQPPVFVDGFERGDVLAWSRVVGTVNDCVDGLAHGSVLSGDLGPAPGGAFLDLACLEIKNDLALERNEVAFSGVPLPASLGLLATDSLALVGPGSSRLAAQFEVLSRWGGPVTDTTRPIRWLQVVVPAPVASNATSRYSLRSYTSLLAAGDPFAAGITDLGGGLYQVETGLATFHLDSAHPALLSQITVDPDDDGVGPRTPVYHHSPGAGPRLVFVDGSTPVTLSTAAAGQVAVDAGGFEIVEGGPVKVVVVVRGHWIGNGESRCTTAGVPAYDRFGFTAVFTFLRGSRDLRLQFQLRNECSQALNEPWTDESVGVVQASWELPFSLSNPMRYYAGELGVMSTVANQVEVEQRRGSDPGSGWVRRAEVRLDGGVVESAELFTRPLVAAGDGELLVLAQMPWMRYREPQSVTLSGSTVSLGFVSGDPTLSPPAAVTLGEGKGIWNFARVGLTPTPLLAGPTATYLESQRHKGAAELERGLLVRAPRDRVDLSRVFPSLGTDTVSPIKTAYLNWLETFHNETVGAGGQWERAKTYGSQYWPESGGNDPFGVDFAFPNESVASMNYWDPAGVELLEFLRSGDPKWVWDFALPQYRTQMYSAYMNLGEHNHGNRNGVAVQSGGPGCAYAPGQCGTLTVCTADGSGGGQWHRSDCGSDDYTYDMGLDLAYVLRPSAAMRDRFGQAGRAMGDRYGVPRSGETTREQFVSQVDLTRGVIQHYELLANCAEFVPGNGVAGDGVGGDDCHQRLVGFVDAGGMGVVSELVLDNLAAGVMCQGDAVVFTPPGRCFTPQQFMQAALMYPFLHRVYRNYGNPPTGSLLRALVEGPQRYYQFGMAKNGSAIDVDGDWAEGLECTLNGGGTAVTTCVDADPAPGNVLLEANKPHSVALLLMAHELDPAVALCQIAKDALDSDSDSDGVPDITLGWGDQHFNQAGWWKGVSQQMQAMAFAVGIYDTCTPP